MSLMFEELDYRETPIGALSLRRRRELSLDVEVYEIKLGDEFLMSSLFTASEIELARLGLAALPDGNGLEVAVGGLGLGYTAQAVLESTAVGSLVVVDALQAVIDWHQDGLLPLGPGLTQDPRCGFILGDFFALAASEDGLDPGQPGRRFDAILVDIDHSPEFLLDLKPGGIFALWSNDRADDGFTARLAEVFDTAWAERVIFHNPLQNKDFEQTVYLARTVKAA
jgi:spermidine synthase